MGEKILVLGALGNVGAEVVKALQARGTEVRGGDLLVKKIQQRFGEAVEAVAFDFSKAETYRPTFHNIEHAFIMRPPHITNIQKYMLPAMQAAKAAGVKHFVFLSLIGIEQNTMVPHYKVEQYLKASGMNYTFLRCSFFMQNLNTVHCAEIRDLDEIFVPVGKTRTSFIDVRDIAQVAAVALTQPGHENKAYDLTGPEGLDYYQVADQFTQVLGRKITYKNPSALAFFLRQVRKSPLMFALVTTWLYSNTKSGMADLVTAEVQRITGREPIHLRQYIQDYRECWAKPE
ncbi:MAG: SDR family oxidoreductase [Chloroflexota bacterium]|jgi:uncharacterized protein YbjT (DUF2867 family)